MPSLRDEFQKRSWEVPSSIDRVYVSDAARAIIGYEPAYGIEELSGGDHLAPMTTGFPTAC